VVVGESKLLADRLQQCSAIHRDSQNFFSSRQLCRVHLCTPYFSNTTGCYECSHWVRDTIYASCPLAHFDLPPISAVLASFLLGEELGHLGRIGCTLCLLGSLIIVLHAPEDKAIDTVDEILHYAIQPGTWKWPPSFLSTLTLVADRVPYVLLHRGRRHTGYDLHGRTEIWSFEPHRLHLHLLSRWFRQCYGYQRLWCCRQVNVRREQPIYTSQHIRVHDHRGTVYNGSDELFQQGSGHVFH